MKSWKIPSDDGWNNVTFVPHLFYPDQDEVEYAIEITGRFWYRPRSETPVAESEYVELESFRIKFPTIIIPVASCKGLLNDFEDWFRDFSPFSRTLCPELQIELGEREGLLSTPERPALTLYCEIARCRLEVFYLVDQSCVRIARDELAALLQSNALESTKTS